ncbi:MAG: sulfite exporter TauE/SafE family protein [Bacteroidota bacterium]
MDIPVWLPFDNWWQLSTLMLASFTIGTGKAGIKGGLLFAIPLLVSAFGGMYAAAILLFPLLVGDALAIYRYGRYAKWPVVRSLVIPAYIGILIATFVGHSMNAERFRDLLSVVILAAVVFLLIREKYPIKPKTMQRPLVAGTAGLVGGFTTMIGNVGGPVMSIYLLSAQMPKYPFLGTGAVFFLLVNLVKLPLHALVWKSLDKQVLYQGAFGTPAVLIGFFLGLILIDRVSEKWFRYLILGLTSLTALTLLLR